MDRADVAVIGGGVVGLAIAREMAERGRSVVLLERHRAFGTEQSTHNSQVIHSGFFAKPGTLRARLNLEGARRLYEMAPLWGVPLDRSGTLVVALHPGDRPRLDRYEAWGRENGVVGLTRCTSAQARDIEPGLGPVIDALHSPNGGRIDAAALLSALEREARALGADLRRKAGLVTASWSGESWTLGEASGKSLAARWVVNAAGVGAGDVAGKLGPPNHRVYPCLGEYASVRGPRRTSIRSMVYGFPAPGFPGIGVHLTRWLSGELVLGPTATYLTTARMPDRSLTTLEEFCREAEPYLPGLTIDDLEAAPAGIRAKVVGPGSGEAFGDFIIDAQPIGRNAVQLFGIESPGLSSCLAIARYVAQMVGAT